MDLDHAIRVLTDTLTNVKYLPFMTNPKGDAMREQFLRARTEQGVIALGDAGQFRMPRGARAHVRADLLTVRPDLEADFAEVLQRAEALNEAIVAYVEKMST